MEMLLPESKDRRRPGMEKASCSKKKPDLYGRKFALGGNQTHELSA
jgi:hypothetical protein